MSTRTGFPRMDWDTGFLADPKFQHLRDLIPDPIRFGYAGFCYLRIVADSWRTCERRPVTVVVRGIEDWAVTVLHEAGLLEDGQLPSEAFEKWVGSALSVRKTWADQKRTQRESRPVLADSRGLLQSPDPSRIGRTGSNGRTGGSGGDQKYERLVATRIRNFRETGVWDEDQWGPKPVD